MTEVKNANDEATPNDGPSQRQRKKSPARAGEGTRKSTGKAPGRFVDDTGAPGVPRRKGGYLLPPLSSGGALVVRPWLRFHTPLIEPDMQISRIRLSDKTSRLHPRQVMPKHGQAYEPEVPVKVWEWIGPALASPNLVLEAQPPAQPHSGVVVDRPARRSGLRSCRSRARCGCDDRSRRPLRTDAQRAK